MSNTACIKIYQLKNNFDFDIIKKELIEKYCYSEFYIDEEIQKRNNVKIISFKRDNSSLPDWVDFIKPYLKISKLFDDFKRYSVIIFFFIKKNNEEYGFVITGGAGSHHILTHLDYLFGIEILERIFDPELNKIDSLKEKGIIGDILASSRYYRRARAIAYEDNFGKYFQDINIKLHKKQIEAYFPSIKNYKKDKLKPLINISCSANLELKMKITLLALINILNDIINIFEIKINRIFNKTLIPFDNRKNKSEIINLNKSLLNKIINACQNNNFDDLDIDICPRNFEDFFVSVNCKINIPNLTKKNKNLSFDPIEIEDINQMSDLNFLLSIYEQIVESNEYNESDNKSEFIEKKFSESILKTFDTEGEEKTSGKLFNFIQTEINISGISYFLLDDSWYELQSKFDDTLNEKYPDKIGKHINKYHFYKKWKKGMEETNYNEQYNNKFNPFYLHLIKVDYIEICDILYFDENIKKLYIIHIKKDIGASIRDLVSQVYISARIIEEETRTKEKNKLKKLYKQAKDNHRIDNNISETKFLEYFEHEKEYCLGIYDDNLTENELCNGKYNSRIAKFSLIEFASMMYTNEWNFSIFNIDTE